MTVGKPVKKAGHERSRTMLPARVGELQPLPAIDEKSLLADLRELVRSARQRIATAAYSTQALLCWRMGRRLADEHLQGGRAPYGQKTLVTVSRELTAEYGRGFSRAEIARLIQFDQAIEHAQEQAARRLGQAEGST